MPPERYRSELQTADVIRAGSQNLTAIRFILYLLQVCPFVSYFSSYMFLYCLKLTIVSIFQSIWWPVPYS